MDEEKMPLFLINGFLEAGKTQFIRFTLNQDYFRTEGRTLLLVCEEGEEEYDGIWACASLLHVARAGLPDVLNRLHKLLKADGILYASFKYGTEDRVKDGRYFCDFTEESCRSLMEQAGFVVREIFVTGDVREGRGDEMWVIVIARRG